jgi:peptidyl-prolyl cis-trans isomerase C
MRPSSRVFTAMCLQAGLVCGIAAQSATAPAGTAVLATVGGQTITADDFGRWLTTVRAQKDYASTLQTVTPEGRAQLLDALVGDRVLALAARADGLDNRADVRFMVEQLTAQILARAYLDAKTRELTPTDAAARQYFDAHPDAFRTVARVKASHILVKTRADAEAARAEVVGGEPFANVAAARSVDPTTKDKGGDVGWVPRGLMVKPFEDALFALKAGEMSAPVESSFGFHIIRADAVDAGSVPSFEAARADVKKRMVTTALDELKRGLAKQYRVAIDADALTRIGR